MNIIGGAAASLPGDRYLTVQPDANGGKLVISHPKYKGSLLIKILDAKGKLVRKVMHNGGTIKEVNIAGLPAGRYSALLNNGKTEVKQNFVKK